MTEDVTQLVQAETEEWRTYDEFAAGIDTFRLPQADLTGTELTVHLDGGPTLQLTFTGPATVSWTSVGVLATTGAAQDPCDAVAVRPDVTFVNLPLTSRERESVTLVFSTTTRRVLAVHSVIAEHAQAGTPQVSQTFWAGTLDGADPTGPMPGPSRDLIGRRNLYRYSPEHLYEHVYISSQRYAWQCLQGVQRGHGDMDLSTVWAFDDDLYLFCFREFKIAVASVWLHDLGPAMRTTGVFLGLTGAGEAEHSRAGGHVIPLGRVDYPDVQPV